MKKERWRQTLVAPLRALFAVAEAVDRFDLPLLSGIPPKRKRRFVAILFRRLSALGPNVVHRRGLTFRVPRDVAYSYLLREHEPETQSLLDTVLRPGMTAVDVGANIGYLTLLMARAVSPGGHVLALEPGPDNRIVLEENVRRNQLGDVVRVLPLAAGSERGKQHLHLGRAGTLHSLHAVGPLEGGNAVSVETVPLDELIEGPADLVKIDVEGAEMAVLLGMPRLLATQPPPRLVVEWNPSALARAGHPPEALPERLAAAGYRLRLLDPDGRRPDGVEAALAELASGRLPATWHANLLAEPRAIGWAPDGARGSA